MRREPHVRFREGGGGEIPLRYSTRDEDAVRRDPATDRRTAAALILRRRERLGCHEFQQEPWERCALPNTKSLFPSLNALASPTWMHGGPPDRQGSGLQTPVQWRQSRLNKPVIA